MGYPYEGWRPDPYGAQPMTGYGQNQYMPQMQGQTGQMAAQSPFTMVPTIADVDKVSLQPRETTWIMGQSDPIFAVKTANAMGYAPAEYYRFDQIDPAAMQTPAEAQYLTSAQADQKIQAAVKAEVERVMAQYQTAPAAPARPARAKEG